MQYTLKQACTALAPLVHDHSAADLVSAINSAVLSLSASDAWDRLRKVIRLRAHGGVFSLPQDAASVVRACVNGTPSSILGQEYRFLTSGPGDLTSVPAGYQPVDPGVIDLGVYPTMHELPVASHLIAYISDYADTQQPAFVVTGHLENGELCTVRLEPARKGAIVLSPGLYASSQKFVDITSVVIDGRATTYLYLYATPTPLSPWSVDDPGIVIGQYHPEVQVPEFHRYMIPGAKRDKTYDLLLEVRVNPLPLVERSDVLPFSSLEPIRYMLEANRYFNLGEIDAGLKYRELALGVLMSTEKTEEKRQTIVVQNMLYQNSLGEMSENYAFL